MMASRFPKTLEAACALVWDAMPSDTKARIKVLPKDLLRQTEQWETLLWIRNLTGLTEGNTDLLAHCAWEVRLQYPLDSAAEVVNHFYENQTMGEIRQLLAASDDSTKPTVRYLQSLAQPDIAAHVILEYLWTELQHEGQ